jgi:hypothetical protein
MTLIAAYRENDRPILLGDFLITAHGARSGTRKKICRISPNLAVGWTGHLLATNQVMGALRRRFEGTRPSRTDLDSFLTTYDVRQFRSFAVHLIGWIVDSDNHCFCWNSDWPTEVFYAPFHYGGSGATTFKALEAEGKSDAGPSAHPAQRALYNACRLMTDEHGARKNRAAGFGYAYEILYLEGGDFVYIDDVTFIFADVSFTQSGKYMDTKLIPFIYRYANMGEMTIVQTHTWKVEKGKPRFHTDRNLITPPFDIPEEEEKRLVADIVRPDFPLSMVGNRIYLLLDLIRDADTPQAYVIAPLICMQWPDDKIKIFEVSFEPSGANNILDGTFTLRMPGRDLLENAFASICRDQDLSNR